MKRSSNRIAATWEYPASESLESSKVGLTLSPVSGDVVAMADYAPLRPVRIAGGFNKYPDGIALTFLRDRYAFKKEIFFLCIGLHDNPVTNLSMIVNDAIVERPVICARSINMSEYSGGWNSAPASGKTNCVPVRPVIGSTSISRSAGRDDILP